MKNTEVTKMSARITDSNLQLPSKTVVTALFVFTTFICNAQNSTSPNGLTVSVPNGYTTIAAEDMFVQSVAGPVRWSRNWDGQEWKFNPYWESLSQSWKNLTGSQTADTTGSTIGGTSNSNSSSGSNGGSSDCWVWVSEDWSPTINAGVAAAMLPERATPFNRVMSESAVDYAAPVRLSVNYSSLCTGTTTSSSVAELEAIRRQSELYLGEGGRYAFSNRAVLEKRTVRAIPASTAAALDAQLSSGNIALSLATNNKGYRWTHKDGSWIDYNTQGQVVAYGDKNDNATWLVRDTTGIVRGVLDGIGRVLYTLHYTGKLLTEVRDAPVASNSLDLPRRSVKYQYDANNRLTQVTDVRGNTIKYEYDALNHIIKITDQEGRIEQINYKGSIVSKRIAPDGGITDYVFEYDDTNKQFISKITGPETAAGRRVEDYAHNRVGKLVRQIVNGRTEIEIKYDTGSRAEIQTNARGFVTRVIKDEFEQIVQIDQPDGTSIKTAYSPLNLQVTEQIDEAGFKTQYQYDGKGNLTRRIEASGTLDERITEFKFNDRGQIIETIHKGKIDLNGTNIPDAVYRFEYDVLGKIKKATDPEGNIEQYVFNRLAKIASSIDGRGNETHYKVDAQGNTIQITDALNRVQNYTYDKLGNLQNSTDSSGNVTRLIHDEMSRATQFLYPTTGKIKIEYNKEGLLLSTTDEVNHTQKTEYDNFRRAIKKIDAAGNITQYSYGIYGGANADGVGSLYVPTETIYPTYIQQNRFDQRERPTTYTYKYRAGENDKSITRTITYEKRGLVQSETDTNGQTHVHTYDALGRRTKTVDALGGTTYLAYDVRGNLLQVTDANGSIYKYEYNLNNKIVKQISPLGKVYEVSYDSAGKISQSIEPKGDRTVYQYDAGQRLIGVKYYDKNGALVRSSIQSWDVNNNLISWIDNDEIRRQTSKAVLVYDEANRKIGETVSYPTPQGGSFSLSYNRVLGLDGNTTNFSLPDGTNIGFDWNAHGELASVAIPGEGSISVNQFKWGMPEKITFPGGVTQSNSYDGLLNLESIKARTSGQKVTLELNNSYGELQELKQRSRSDTIGNATNTKVENYFYDVELRLTKTTSDNGGLFGSDIENFSLDLVGNRVSHSRQSGAWVYDANNQLIKRGDGACGSNGSVCYEYDDNGNLIKKVEGQRVIQYTYDGSNRLIEVHDGQTNLVARYGYDPLNRRIWKEQYRDQMGNSVAQALRIYYFYSDEGLIAEATQTIELNSDHTVTAQQTPQITTQYGLKPGSSYGTGVLFIKTKDNNEQESIAYFHHDHLGTPVQATDKLGNVVWAAGYTAFGSANILVSDSQQVRITSNLRLPGQYEDVETGLHYNYSRYYDPQIGRYIQSDPIGFLGGKNFYAYAGGDPLSYFDNLGLMPTCKPVYGPPEDVISKEVEEEILSTSYGVGMRNARMGVGGELPERPRGRNRVLSPEIQFDLWWYKVEMVRKSIFQRHQIWQNITHYCTEDITYDCGRTEHYYNVVKERKKSLDERTPISSKVSERREWLWIFLELSLPLPLP